MYVIHVAKSSPFQFLGVFVFSIIKKTKIGALKYFKYYSFGKEECM